MKISSFHFHTLSVNKKNSDYIQV